MKIKTFMNLNPTLLDEAVNKFEEDNDVKATQTDMIVFEGAIFHKAVVFYRK